MSGTNSPSQLNPPQRLRPRRLNRIPLLIGIIICAILIVAMLYAFEQRIVQSLGGRETSTTVAAERLHGGKPPVFSEAAFSESPPTSKPPPPPPEPEVPLATSSPPAEANSGGLTVDEQARAQAWAAYYQALQHAQEARETMRQAVFTSSTDAMAGGGESGNGITQPPGAVGDQPGSPLQNNAGANGVGPYSIGGVNPAGQTGKQAFLKSAGDPYGLSENMEGSVHGPKPLTIMEGTALPAITAEAATSDSPGQLVAIINTNVCDDMTGDNLLIPQGTKVITTYDTAVSIGQERMGTIAQRLIFPDTSSRQIGSMQVADQSGQAGLHDLLKTHFWEKFGTALTVAVIGAGTQLAQPQQSAFASPSSASAATGAFTQQMSQFGINQAQSAMQIPNTIELRPGLPILVKFNKDLALPIYHDARGGMITDGCGFTTR